MQSAEKEFLFNNYQESPLDLSRGHSTSSMSASISPNTRANLPCHVCAKCFDRPSLLKRHMRTHTGEKPHICDICSKAFSTSSSLNTHRRIHSGEKPHQCPICGKRFTASSNLYYHRMTHTKDKPHKCLTCNKSFPTPGDLRAHGYTHTGSWPFRCSLCQRGFSKQTNLRNHLFLHTGDKPHKCEVCDKRFALACNLRAHSKTHGVDFAKKESPGERSSKSLNSLASSFGSIKIAQKQIINWNKSTEICSTTQTLSILDYHLLLLHLANFQKIPIEK